MTSFSSIKSVGDVAGEDVGALVVDCGTYMTKIGYAGDDTPKVYTPSCVGEIEKSEGEAKELRYPLNFYTKATNMSVSPLFVRSRNQITINPEVFETIIESACGCQQRNADIGGLGVNIAEVPVLLTEASKHSRLTREKIVEVMFEKFNVPATYLVKKAVLSAFAVGRASGLTVDIGASSTCVVPVVEGYSLQKNILEFPVGGDLLDKELAALLEMKKLQVDPVYGVKKTSKGVVRNNLSNVHPTYLNYSVAEVLRNLRECVCRCAEEEADITEANQSEPSWASGVPGGMYYELPDGTKLDVQPYTYRVPELFFNPDLAVTTNQLKNFKGLPHAVADCINSCDVDLRRDLLNAIIFTGGGSLTPSLPERTSRRLQEDDTLLGSGTRFKIVAPSTAIERKFGTWIGGSILASLGTFQHMWFTLEEYREHGTQVVERKCA